MATPSGNEGRRAGKLYLARDPFERGQRMVPLSLAAEPPLGVSVGETGTKHRETPLRDGERGERCHPIATHSRLTELHHTSDATRVISTRESCLALRL